LSRRGPSRPGVAARGGAAGADSGARGRCCRPSRIGRNPPPVCWWREESRC